MQIKLTLHGFTETVFGSLDSKLSVGPIPLKILGKYLGCVKFLCLCVYVLMCVCVSVFIYYYAYILLCLYTYILSLHIFHSPIPLKNLVNDDKSFEIPKLDKNGKPLKSAEKKKKVPSYTYTHIHIHTYTYTYTHIHI
jgi:hypothetical protein